MHQGQRDQLHRDHGRVGGPAAGTGACVCRSVSAIFSILGTEDVGGAQDKPRGRTDVLELGSAAGRWSEVVPRPLDTPSLVFYSTRCHTWFDFVKSPVQLCLFFVFIFVFLAHI